jgi:hypothetical protein
MVEDLGDAADMRGYDGGAGSECLEDDIWDAFVLAGEGEEIGGSHEWGDFVSRFAPGEEYAGGEVELGDEIAAGFFEGASADHYQGNGVGIL